MRAHGFREPGFQKAFRRAHLRFHRNHLVEDIFCTMDFIIIGILALRKKIRIELEEKGALQSPGASLLPPVFDLALTLELLTPDNCLLMALP